MITKKKLKTKFDYQVRTLGICTLMFSFFTAFIISPDVEELKIENENIKTQIQIEEDKNTKLHNDLEEILSSNTIMTEE